MAPRKASPRRKRAAADRLAPLKEELGVALERSIAELDAAGIAFALVGGLAIGVRADPRVTRDIDYVVPASDDAQAEAILFALQQRGFFVEAVFVRDQGRISTVRTRHRSAPDVLVDLLFSNARIEQEIVDESSREEIATGIECPVAQAWHLLAMKVLANRKKDQPDLQDLIEGASASVVARAEAALRLMQRRGVAPKRDLIAELHRLVRDIRGQPRFEKPIGPARLARIRRRNRTFDRKR